jgi:predicted transcriptional regulator
MGKLREGKGVVQAIIKEEIIEKLDEMAVEESTSRSAIAGKIIEENYIKYVKKTPSK